MNHDMKSFSLPNDSFTLLNAELNEKQILKRTYLKKLPAQRLEIERIIIILYFTTVSLKEVPGRLPGTHKGVRAPHWAPLALL
jgi:hypothetical protein